MRHDANRDHDYLRPLVPVPTRADRLGKRFAALKFEPHDWRFRLINRIDRVLALVCFLGITFGWVLYSVSVIRPKLF